MSSQNSESQQSYESVMGRNSHILNNVNTTSVKLLDQYFDQSDTNIDTLTDHIINNNTHLIDIDIKYKPIPGPKLNIVSGWLTQEELLYDSFRKRILDPGNNRMHDVHARYLFSKHTSSSCLEGSGTSGGGVLLKMIKSILSYDNDPNIPRLQFKTRTIIEEVKIGEINIWSSQSYGLNNDIIHVPLSGSPFCQVDQNLFELSFLASILSTNKTKKVVFYGCKDSLSINTITNPKTFIEKKIRVLRWWLDLWKGTGICPVSLFYSSLLLFVGSKGNSTYQSTIPYGSNKYLSFNFSMTDKSLKIYYNMCFELYKLKLNAKNSTSQMKNSDKIKQSSSNLVSSSSSISKEVPFVTVTRDDGTSFKFTKDISTLNKFINFIYKKEVKPFIFKKNKHSTKLFLNGFNQLPGTYNLEISPPNPLVIWSLLQGDTIIQRKPSFEALPLITSRGDLLRWVYRSYVLTSLYVDRQSFINSLPMELSIYGLRYKIESNNKKFTHIRDVNHEKTWSTVFSKCGFSLTSVYHSSTCKYDNPHFSDLITGTVSFHKFPLFYWKKITGSTILPNYSTTELTFGEFSNLSNKAGNWKRLKFGTRPVFLTVGEDNGIKQSTILMVNSIGNAVEYNTQNVFCLHDEIFTVSGICSYSFIPKWFVLKNLEYYFVCRYSTFSSTNTLITFNNYHCDSGFSQSSDQHHVSSFNEMISCGFRD